MALSQKAPFISGKVDLGKRVTKHSSRRIVMPGTAKEFTKKA